MCIHSNPPKTFRLSGTSRRKFHSNSIPVGRRNGKSCFSVVCNERLRSTETIGILSIETYQVLLQSTSLIGTFPQPLQAMVRSMYADGYKRQMRITIALAAAQVPAAFLMWQKGSHKKVLASGDSRPGHLAKGFQAELAQNLRENSKLLRVDEEYLSAQRMSQSTFSPSERRLMQRVVERSISPFICHLCANMHPACDFRPRYRSRYVLWPPPCTSTALPSIRRERLISRLLPDQILSSAPHIPHRPLLRDE